jgi:tetratricopeptide (TPR) repeat protein
VPITEPEHIANIGKRVAALIRERRHLEAITLLNEKSSETGKYMKLSWNLGWCYFHLRRFDEARKHLLRANELAPENATCKWALGLVYLKQKEFAKAELLLAEALREKDIGHVRGALALAYLSQRKVAQAEATHLEGITLKPNSSRRYELYAAFLSDVGRHAEAERMSQKAKQLGGVN